MAKRSVKLLILAIKFSLRILDNFSLIARSLPIKLTRIMSQIR